MAGVHGIPTGIHRYFKELCFDGYNLVPPYFSKNTYLLNMEGEIVHTWKSDYLPGLYAMLQEDGTLVRGIRLPDAAVRFAGVSGGFERLDWNGNVLQRYIKNDHETHECLSHAFCPMPNGHTMVICLENKSCEEAYAKGRKPNTLPAKGTMINGLLHDGLYLDYLMEIDQDNNVVWEWHLWDHIGTGQDEFDLNYRLPETYGYYCTHDWVHFNGVDYDPVHDRVVACCRNFAEFVIIDRKTGKKLSEMSDYENLTTVQKADILKEVNNNIINKFDKRFIYNSKITDITLPTFDKSEKTVLPEEHDDR